MSKPKIIWAEMANRNCTIAYCNYGTVKIALDHELKESNDHEKRDKFRIRCLSPKNRELSKPVTFESKELAWNTAELEAMRIYNDLPAIDYDKISDWRTKAQKYEEVVALLKPINKNPVQAAYELVGLHEMTGNRTPADAIGRWYDEFERVKVHMTIGEIIEAQLKEVERSRKTCSSTKRDKASILRTFVTDIGADLKAESITVDEMAEYFWDIPCDGKRAYERWRFIREAFTLAYQRYGAITKWTYERLMDLNYSAKAGKLTILMGLPLLKEIFLRCKFSNDALYLGILSWIPFRCV